VGVSRHQRPCIAGNIGFGQEVFQAFEQVFAVFVVFKDLATFDTPNDHMVQDAGGI